MGFWSPTPAVLRAILAFCRGLGREGTAILCSVTGAEAHVTLTWFWQLHPQQPLPVPPAQRAATHRAGPGGALLLLFPADREWDKLFSAG